MTVRVYFYADQVFFDFVNKTIKNLSKYNDDELYEQESMETATCIIMCSAAIESFLNVFAQRINIPEYAEFQKKSIKDKINNMYVNVSKKPDWSKGSLQDITNLTRVRNWLVHFKIKDNNIGLTNHYEWIVDDVNKYPILDPCLELKFSRVKRYYESSRQILFDIASLYDLQEEFEYLKDENYLSNFLVG